MQKTVVCGLLFLGLFSSCSKQEVYLKKPVTSRQEKTGDFVAYNIKTGEHFASLNFYHAIEASELKFAVIFDSSAIYKTTDPANQYDINKLYGFSDNNAEHHHQYSARFGWAWNEDSLRLYAYVYNEGQVYKKELGTAAIGAQIICSIKVAANSYIFSINEKNTHVPRSSTMSTAKGYILYPYFGGDEPAPHDITIRIKNL